MFIALLNLLVVLPISNEACIKWLQSNKTSNLMTHNSYHQAPILNYPSINNTKINVTIPIYSYSPGSNSLVQQLNRNIRGIELDMHPKQGNDYPVYHLGWDSSTSCDTLSTCLNEINSWINNQTTDFEPILIQLEIKDMSLTNSSWSISDLHIIKDIINQTIGINNVYTPYMHGVGLGNHSINETWPNWENICQSSVNNHVIFMFELSNLNSIISDTPGLQSSNTLVSAQNISQTSSALNFFFPFCNDLNDGIACSILGEVSATLLTQYPTVVNAFDTYPVRLEQAFNFRFASNGSWIEAFLPDIVYNDALSFESNLINPISASLFNAWMFSGYIDAQGNNDGYLNSSDIATFLSSGDPSYLQYVAYVNILFQDIEGYHINNPSVWRKIESVAKSVSLLNAFIPDFNKDMLLKERCEMLSIGYTYFKNDYPYDYGAWGGYSINNTVKELLENEALCSYYSPTPSPVTQDTSSGQRGRLDYLNYYYISYAVGSLLYWYLLMY